MDDNAAPFDPDNSDSVPEHLAESPLITLRVIGLMEAELAQAKLDSEGIPSFIVDQAMAVTQPFLVSSVRLQVHAADAARADEILARPAIDDGEGDYADESFRCPKCHRRKIDLVPLPRFWRRVRTAWIMLMILPFVLSVFEWLVPQGELRPVLDALGQGWVILLWFIVCMALGVTFFLLGREKRCVDCGWQW